jgi:hypothetical protein
MDITQFLTQQGLSAEEITAITGNPAQAKAMTAALQQFEAGQAATAAAQAQQKETETYWASKTTDLATIETKQKELRDKAAAAEARLAARTAWLQNLKTAGYDIPDEVIGAGAPVNPVGVSPTDPNLRAPDTGQFMTRDEWDKRARSIAPDLVTLTALSNEYQYLNGKPYTDINADFAEASKQGKPLTEYVRTKYDFAAKHAAKEQAAQEASYQERYQKDLAAERAKWAQEHGPNPNTRVPLPSSFDKLASQPGFDSKSWANAETRKANRAARMEKFSNADFKARVQ